MRGNDLKIKQETVGVITVALFYIIFFLTSNSLNSILSDYYLYALGVWFIIPALAVLLNKTKFKHNIKPKKLYTIRLFSMIVIVFFSFIVVVKLNLITEIIGQNYVEGFEIGFTTDVDGYTGQQYMVTDFHSSNWTGRFILGVSEPILAILCIAFPWITWSEISRTFN